MELKQYWSIIRRRLWLIALIALAGAAITGAYSVYFVDAQYAASTKIIVNQKEYPGGLVQDPRSIDYNINLIKTYKEIIKTPRIMNAVIREYPELKVSLSRLISSVSVSTVNGTQVMSVTAKDDTYKRAAGIANAVTIVFQQEIPQLMNVDNVNILNEADPNANPRPLSPNVSTNIALGTIFFFVLGLGLVLLLNYLDDSVKSESDLKRLLGLPTFGHIPRMRRIRKKERMQSPNANNPIRSGESATINL